MTDIDVAVPQIKAVVLPYCYVSLVPFALVAIEDVTRVDHTPVKWRGCLQRCRVSSGIESVAVAFFQAAVGAEPGAGRRALLALRTNCHRFLPQKYKDSADDRCSEQE